MPLRALDRRGGRALAAAAAAVLVIPTALPAQAGARDRIDVADKIVDVDGAGRVKLDFPAGQCTVLGTDDDRVRLEVWAECKGGSRCADRVERIRVRSDHDGDAVRFAVDNYPKIDTNFHLEAMLYVPEHLALDVDMGAGELEIRHVGDDLQAELGAGSVQVRLDERLVRSVSLDVGVGDASLRRPGRSHHGKGWLGKSVHWDQGQGRARVKIDVGVGEASVRLE
jgi:hypothetical protein